MYRVFRVFGAQKPFSLYRGSVYFFSIYLEHLEQEI